MSIDSFSLYYQKSPIILTNGIASNVPGGMLPIISITQAEQFGRGILNASGPIDLQDFLYDFYPLPGATLIENQVATYPFANQSVAANAIIFQPLHVSLEMLAPVRTAGGYNAKLANFQTLQSALSQHSAAGGTYTVATPSFLYTNCILTSFRDISQGNPDRPQDRWQLDFFQPLLTVNAAIAAQNSLNQKITAQTKIVPGPNGQISSSGLLVNLNNPQSLVGSQAVPAAGTIVGSTVAGASPLGVTQ